MSRVRASSQGPRKPFGGGAQPLSLEQMRERMLTRRNVDLRMNPTDVQRPAERPPTSGTAQPLFVGRSLVISNSPPHPSSKADDAADPHKLFQMLRRKKRAAAPAAQPSAAGSSVAAATRHSPDRSQPHPRVDAPSSDAPPLATAQAASVPPPPPSDVPPRPQGAGRPLGAMRQAFSAGAAHPPPASQQGPRPREVSSATPIPSSNSAPDGRPVTRQKLPTQALDLFPSTSPGADKPGKAPSEKIKGDVSEADPFPKPAPAAGQRKGSASRQMPGANAADPVANGGKRVDFSCLFVSGEGDLGMPDEFPSSPNAKVDIPLIETEWFNPQSTWEALPGGAEEAVPLGKGGVRSNEGSMDIDAADTSQSLYDLLVATKGRRSATNRR